MKKEIVGVRIWKGNTETLEHVAGLRKTFLKMFQLKNFLLSLAYSAIAFVKISIIVARDHNEGGNSSIGDYRRLQDWVTSLGLNKIRRYNDLKFKEAVKGPRLVQN